MHLTLAPLLPSLSAAGAAWLMVRAGVSKKRLEVRTAPRCPACGTRRTRDGCRCTSGR